MTDSCHNPCLIIITATKDVYKSFYETLAEYLKNFEAQPSQCGLLVSIGGKVAGLIFYHSPMPIMLYIQSFCEATALMQ